MSHPQDCPASVTSADGIFTLTQPPGGTLTAEQMAEIANEVARQAASQERVKVVRRALTHFIDHGWVLIPDGSPREENGKVC